MTLWSSTHLNALRDFAGSLAAEMLTCVCVSAVVTHFISIVLGEKIKHDTIYFLTQADTILLYGDTKKMTSRKEQLKEILKATFFP